MRSIHKSFQNHTSSDPSPVVTRLPLPPLNIPTSASNNSYVSLPFLLSRDLCNPCPRCDGIRPVPGPVGSFLVAVVVPLLVMVEMMPIFLRRGRRAGTLPTMMAMPISIKVQM